VQQAIAVARAYKPTTQDKVEAEWQTRGISSLLNNEKTHDAFIDEYFGAANLLRAQRVKKWKEFGEKYLEAKRRREELEQLQMGR
jgi:hypothetical protein